MPITAPTASEFRTRFPEFTASDHSDDKVAALIATASRMSYTSLEALYYLIAHLVAISAEDAGKPDGGSGEVQSESQGEQSVSYSTMSSDQGDVFFTRTSYGRMFLQLRKNSPGFALGIKVVA